MPWQDYDKLAWYHDPEQDIAKFIHLALENMDDNNTHSLASQVQLSIAVAEFLFDNDVETNTRVIQSVPKGDFGDKAALFVHDGPFHKHLVQARVSDAEGVPRLGPAMGYGGEVRALYETTDASSALDDFACRWAGWRPLPYGLEQAAVEHLARHWDAVPSTLRDYAAHRLFARELSTCASLFVVQGRPFQLIVTERSDKARELEPIKRLIPDPEKRALSPLHEEITPLPHHSGAACAECTTWDTVCSKIIWDTDTCHNSDLLGLNYLGDPDEISWIFGPLKLTLFGIDGELRERLENAEVLSASQKIHIVHILWIMLCIRSRRLHPALKNHGSRANPFSLEQTMIPAVWNIGLDTEAWRGPGEGKGEYED